MIKTKEQKTIWWLNKQSKRKKYLNKINPPFKSRVGYWYNRFQKQTHRIKGEYIFKLDYNFKTKIIKVGFRHLNGKERYLTESCNS
jgi:CRISPR/Cas system-associated protein Cas5 (RAMP superfamily)